MLSVMDAFRIKHFSPTYIIFSSILLKCLKLVTLLILKLLIRIHSLLKGRFFWLLKAVITQRKHVISALVTCLISLSCSHPTFLPCCVSRKELWKLLSSLKTTVEGLVSTNNPNVWSRYGGLQRLHKDMNNILSHELKNEQVIF